jgi:hypothetical protein
MRYFKAIITYQLDSSDQTAAQLDQVLYCCSAADLPSAEQLRELFYSLDGVGKNFKTATCKQVREEDIPTEEIHLI